MKRFIALLLLLPLMGGCVSEVVLEAAQLPFTVHAVWDLPTDGATVQYLVVSDSDPAITVTVASCTTNCSTPITVSAFGSHTLTVTPQYLAISTDPTSITSGDASTVATLKWVLNNSATAVKTLKVGK